MAEEDKRQVCGIVMPISAIDGCTESHWSDVLDIVSEAIEAADFSPNLVSNADDVGIIHKRIIQNLYDNPIVVCDVSCKNPNVMFELGLRLAFDKPTIIIKDDKTTYSFDTSAIEHLEYPRDLRFSKIVEFKEKLAGKIAATYKKSTQEKDYTTFLKHFGEFTVAKLDKKEVSGQEYILEELRVMRHAMMRLENRQAMSGKRFSSEIEPMEHAAINVCLGGRSPAARSKALKAAASYPGLENVRLIARGGDHFHLLADIAEGVHVDLSEIEKLTGGRLRPNRIVGKRVERDA